MAETYKKVRNQGMQSNSNKTVCAVFECVDASTLADLEAATRNNLGEDVVIEKSLLTSYTVNRRNEM